MYWVGDSSVFLHKPRSSAEQSLPCPPRSWTASVGPTKKLGYAVPIVLLAWFRERSPPCRCLPRAFSALVFFLSLFQWIRSPAKGAALVQKGRTLLSQPWLPVWSLLQNVISSWREKDTKTYDAVREAQNNVWLFKWQTSQAGAASSAAEEGWFKMIKQKVLQNAA